MEYDKIYWENASYKEKKRDGKGESEVTKRRERENYMVEEEEEELR